MRERTMRAPEARDGLSSLACLPRATCAAIYTSKISSAYYQVTESKELDKKNIVDRFANIFEMLKRNDEDASNPAVWHFNLPNYSGQDIRNHGSLQSLPSSRLAASAELNAWLSSLPDVSYMPRYFGSNSSIPREILLTKPFTRLKRSI